MQVLHSLEKLFLSRILSEIISIFTNFCSLRPKKRTCYMVFFL